MSRISRVIAIILALVITVSGSHAFAATYTDDDSFYNNNDIMFYSKQFSTGCTANTQAGQATSDKGNSATAYNYLVGKGLSAVQASAVVGNLMQESTVNPTAKNPKGAYGIAQWLGGRLSELKQKNNYDTIEVQLDYLWYELNTSEGASYKVLKNYNGSSAGELAVKFGEAFERYGDGEEGNRSQYANDIYKQYGAGGATFGLGDTCTVTGAGNFVYYSQTDPKWAKVVYGTGTIGPDGCGPTSVAMIVSTLFDKTATPDVIAKLGNANGSYIDGVGTNHTKLLDAAGQRYGFSYTNLTNEGIDKAISVVQNGGLVYMAGSGAAPFTSSGHIVVLRGVTADGKLIIADPYRGESDTYTKEQVEDGRGSTFGISAS